MFLDTDIWATGSDWETTNFQDGDDDLLFSRGISVNAYKLLKPVKNILLLDLVRNFQPGIPLMMITIIENDIDMMIVIIVINFVYTHNNASSKIT